MVDIAKKRDTIANPFVLGVCTWARVLKLALGKSAGRKADLVELS